MDFEKKVTVVRAMPLKPVEGWEYGKQTEAIVTKLFNEKYSIYKTVPWGGNSGYEVYSSKEKMEECFRLLPTF